VREDRKHRHGDVRLRFQDGREVAPCDRQASHRRGCLHPGRPADPGRQDRELEELPGPSVTVPPPGSSTVTLPSFEDEHARPFLSGLREDVPGGRLELGDHGADPDERVVVQVGEDGDGAELRHERCVHGQQPHPALSHAHTLAIGRMAPWIRRRKRCRDGVPDGVGQHG
jgi:hypothetical protein